MFVVVSQVGCQDVVLLDDQADVVVDGVVLDTDVVEVDQADVVLYHGVDVVEPAEQEDNGGVNLPETQVSHSASSSHLLNRKQISVCHEK